MCRRSADNRQTCGEVHALIHSQRLERSQSLVVIHGQNSIKIATVTRAHESISRERTETLNALCHHFLHSRNNYFGFFATQQSVVTSMRVQREYGNTRRINTEISLQRMMENGHLLNNQFFCNGRSDILNRDMTCNQSHTEIILHQDHQRLVSITHTLFNIFCMSWESEVLRLDGMLVDWSCNKYINQTFAIILQCFFQSIQ